MMPFKEILKFDVKKKGLGSEFPLTIGTLESCPSIQSAQILEKEMAQFELYSHTNTNHFDPYGKSMKLANRTFRHVDHIEDYWVNCRDDFDVHRRRFSRMALKMIRMYRIMEVPNQVQDDDTSLIQQYDYEPYRNNPFP